MQSCELTFRVEKDFAAEDLKARLIYLSTANDLGAKEDFYSPS
jgi:hypothetical protein